MSAPAETKNLPSELMWSELTSAASEPCRYGGCLDSSALNYASSADFDDGTCEDAVPGCPDSHFENYMSAANLDDGSCVRGGCVDPLYPNYDSRATYNDNSCEMGGGAGCTVSESKAPEAPQCAGANPDWELTEASETLHIQWGTGCRWTRCRLRASHRPRA